MSFLDEARADVDLRFQPGGPFRAPCRTSMIPKSPNEMWPILNHAMLAAAFPVFLEGSSGHEKHLSQSGS